MHLRGNVQWAHPAKSRLRLASSLKLKLTSDLTPGLDGSGSTMSTMAACCAVSGLHNDARRGCSR